MTLKIMSMEEASYLTEKPQRVEGGERGRKGKGGGKGRGKASEAQYKPQEREPLKAIIFEFGDRPFKYAMLAQYTS